MNDERKITIFRPGKAFPSVSVTGSGCDLMCLHCKAEHLRKMVPATTSEQLLKIARDIKEDGGTGMLISGGCDLRGRVPVSDLCGTISQITEMGLKVNVHPGHISREEAEGLVEAGVDAFSVDVHQDPLTIRNVLNLEEDPDIYSRTMENILSVSGNMIPHMTLGFGTDDMVLSAELLRSMEIRDITVLALVRTRNTDIMEMPPEDILNGISYLLGMGFNVTLGCMRPRSHYLERECIRMGIRKIANPSLETVRWALDNGYTVEEIKRCCCL